MKKILLGVCLALLLLIAYVLIRTLTFASTQIEIAPIELNSTPAGAVDRFVQSLTIRTVSFEDPADFDSTQFELFNQHLEQSYPLVHNQLEHKVFNTYSHLFSWKGTDPSLAPIVLMGHLDVVPIASPYKWTVHPFTEGVKNDTIYGRGTMDDKINVIGILEATEDLLREGFQPQRTVYLSFGHDEEASGHLGAEAIVNYLHDQGVKAACVLDEGGMITSGLFPGLQGEVAVIGVAEKGYLSLELEVNMEGGHSSSPAPESSIDVLAQAIGKVKEHPFDAKITPVLQGMMDKVGPELGFTSRLAFANPAIFKSLILGTYEKSRSGNAMVRTTISPTIFDAGIKENVIPTAARGVINFRILPGETIESVITHVQSSINDDRVIIRTLGSGFNPSPISPDDNSAFQLIETSIKQVYPGMLTSPYLVIGATDARYFYKISDNVYRFTPYQVNSTNLSCFHGIDERIGVNEYEHAIRFYRQMILNGQGAL